MKKLVSIICIFVLCLSLFAGCGKTKESEISLPEESTSEQSEKEPDPETSESESAEEIVIEYFSDDVPTGDQQREMLESNVPEREKFEAVDEIKLTGKYSDSFPIVTNDTPLDKIAKTITNPYIVYGTTDMLFGREAINWYNEPYNNPKTETKVTQFSINTIYNNITSNDHVYYNEVYNSLPLDFLRKTDVDGWYYSVAKFNTGYLYSFFGPLYENDGTGKYAPLLDDETNLYFYGSLYAENVKSYSDFANIKIGSSISDVVAIDSTAKLAVATNRHYRLAGLKSNGVAFFRVRRSYLLLTDGILEIAYEPREIKGQDYYGSTVYPNENDDLVVCAINYYPDYNYLPKSSGSVTDGYTTYYDPDVAIPIHILPQDYPPAN